MSLGKLMNGVLIVDDEQSILSAISRSLKDEPYKVYTAGSSIEALMVLENNTIDTIVCDYQLSDSRGSDLLQQVSRRWAHITRIMLTGYNTHEVVRDSLNKGGIFKFLTKPWDDHELKLVIESAIKKSFVVNDNLRLIKDIEEKNTKIQQAAEEIERRLKLKEIKLEKSKESVVSYQLQINAVNDLLTRISSARSLKDIVASILDGIRTVVRSEYASIVSITESSKECSVYSSGRQETITISDYSDFETLMDTMSRNNLCILYLIKKVY
jgi:response regulator RpfG family c-di-GMP phosphodiesterase